MSHYHHLTLRDRVFISALTISGKSLSEIACAIGKNVSTISRELKRNKAASAQDGASAVYDPCAAQARYQRQRKHCGKRNILKSDSLMTRLVSNLLVKKFWSPEQIQYRLSKELPNLRISATTIYRGINSGFLDRFVDPEFPIYLYIAGFRRQFSSPSRSKTSLWRPKISPSQTFPVDEL